MSFEGFVWFPKHRFWSIPDIHAELEGLRVVHPDQVESNRQFMKALCYLPIEAVSKEAHGAINSMIAKIPFDPKT